MLLEEALFPLQTGIGPDSACSRSGGQEKAEEARLQDCWVGKGE